MRGWFAQLLRTTGSPWPQLPRSRANCQQYTAICTYFPERATSIADSEDNGDMKGVTKDSVYGQRPTYIQRGSEGGVAEKMENRENVPLSCR